MAGWQLPDGWTPDEAAQFARRLSEWADGHALALLTYRLHNPEVTPDVAERLEAAETAAIRVLDAALRLRRNATAATRAS